jgi:hypothetical protein
MNAWGEKLRHGLILVVAILMMSTPVAGAVSFADGSMSGDISSVPMDTAQTQSQAKNVDARILNFYSDEGDFEPGDQVTAEVEVRNTGDSSHTFFVGYSVIDPSGEYYDNDGQTGRTVTLDSNEREFVSVSWTVQDDSPTGEYDAVTSIWAESDKDNLQTRLDNERRNNVFEVVEPTVVDAQITDFDVESGEFKQSDTVDATATVENTGNTEHTFFVGYSAVGENDESYDNDDETGQTVTLDPDEEESVSLEWMVEDDVPTGEYSAVTSVWKESDRNNLNTQLDRIQRNDAFKVAEPTEISARITSFSIDRGEFTQGESVAATATVENTGNTEHTFFVGYSVVGTNGESYDNNDETGRAVTLGPGESRTISLSWTVQRNTPTGTYDAVTVVWKESDQDNLNTPLDRIQRGDAIEVTEPTEISARVTSFSVDRGEFTQGKSVAATATVENTGNTKHTFFVGYSVIGTNGKSYDNNDETGQTVTLGPDESRTISLSWTVQSNTPTGTYDAVTVVWKESDRDNLNTPLDRTQRSDAFEVATEQQFGKITGTVTGPDGTPITGARVYLDSGSRQTRTNDSGKFSFAEVTAKGHQIRIVTVEYDPKTISITVGGGEEVTRQIRLGDTSVRPADVSVSLSTINNRQYDGGVLETSSVRNLTVEVTGPNGITVRGADAKINPVIRPDRSELYSFETRKVSAGTFRFSTEDYSISSGTGYQYYRIALQIEDESITRVISIPVISGRDKLQTPIEGWRAGHLNKPVIVDEQRYTAVWMSRFDYQRENPDRPAYTWVIYDQNGQLVTDSETVRKAAQAATISAFYTSDELERFLSEEYPKKLKRLIRIDQSIQFAELVRDTSAETLGAVANAYVTGGSGVAAKEATGSAAKLTAKKATKLAAEKLAKKIVIAIDDNDVSPSAFLQDPMGTYERVTRKIAFAEMRASAVQSRQAGAVLRGHPDDKPWSYEESQKFWQNYNESMTDGTLYSQARGERLSGSNTPTDTLKNIGLNFAEGATGPVPVTTLKSYADFVNLLKNGKLGKGMEAAVANTASIRQDMAVAQQSFDGRPVEVANKLQAAGGTTLDSESPPDRSKSATVAIQQLPRGPISEGKTADLTVSVTNTGSSTDRFFVGYSVAVDSGKSTTYYDNKGTTGKFVTIKPAETRTIELSWAASENVPQNVNYNIVTAVWSDLPSKAATLHDKTRRKDVFKVESPGKISITRFNAPERTTQGTVELTTTIKNTKSFGTRIGVVVQDGDQRLGNTSVLFVPANGERTVTLDPKLEATGTRQLQIIAGDQQATATDTVEVATTPGSDVGVTRTVSSQEVAPNEEITVRTEISGVSGEIALNTTHDPGVRTATIQSVTVNGVSVDPTLATAGPQGSVVAIKDVGSSATVVVSKQITVANNEGVTHSITGDVSTSDRDTTIVFDPVSVRVTADQGSPSVVDEYDTDGDGEISVVELGQAGQDYAAGKLTITELGKIGGNFAS